ncbi:MAG: HAD family hydrolase [Tyzzerella sp.]|nr:HAD family hydrolase [Tyzzerella sp.]
MYKACIFDLDGTLTDTLESLTYSVNATLSELGLSQITAEQCKAFVGSGARKLIERSLEAAGDPELLHVEQAMEVYGRIFKENCTYHVAPYEGITEMLETLKKAEVRLAVLSNKPHLQTKDVVTTFFGRDTFVSVQGQQEGVPRKPDPTALFMIAKELNVDIEECLYIGDSDVDMETGCAAKVTTIGVTWGFRSKEVLKEHGAVYIVDQAEEIISIVKGEK